MRHPAFGVETIDLDLPELAGALSRRLHDAGMPVTPGRSIDFTRALTIVRPVARRQLYWTTRAVFVSDQAQVPVFDAVFFSIFGAGPGAEDAVRDAPSRTASPNERPRPEHAASNEIGPSSFPSPAQVRPARMTRSGWSSRRAGERRGAAAAYELRRAAPHELARLYELMSRLELATPAAAHAALRAQAAR